MRLPVSVAKALALIFAPLSATAVLDVVDAAAAGAATLKAATATTVAAQTWLPADLIGAGITALASCPRQLQFTTAGVTPADAPATCIVKGWTLAGYVEETIALAQTATTANSVNYFARIDRIEFAVGDGTGATIALGFTANLGLPAKLKGRGAAGAVLRIKQELVDGAAPVAGALIAAATAKPYGAYTPNAGTAAANGARDFLLEFEVDA